MVKLSAGILLYRRHDRALEFILVHPGGPFWAKKDDGAWFGPPEAERKILPGQKPIIDALLQRLSAARGG